MKFCGQNRNSVLGDFPEKCSFSSAENNNNNNPSISEEHVVWGSWAHPKNTRDSHFFRGWDQ